MNFDELNDIFDFDLGDEADPPETPDFRATIRAGRLTVIAWSPCLFGEGPNGKLVRDRAADGVTIADLRLVGEGPRELIVSYLAVADRARADRLLIGWARAVGHARVWLPDRVVALEPDCPLGAARVRCPTCGADWEDSGADFWAQVRRLGQFPNICPICHGDLPQWRWRPTARDATRRRRPRR